MTEVKGVTQPKHLINGEWVVGSGSERFDVFDPATGEKVSELVSASLDEVDAAVAAAVAAFPAWSKLSLQRRVQFLYDMRQNIFDNIDAIAETLSLDHGKTLAEAKGEVGRAAVAIECAIATPMIYHSNSGNIAEGIDAHHVREPIGACVAVTPSNFPTMNPAQFAGWALVTGNTLVIKPSEQDPMASTAMIQVLQASGLPAGVLNLVHGGVEVSRRVVGHPDVVAVSCITSTPTAKAIYEQATREGKRVQANGGAKNPIVVADDADLEQAALGIIDSAFGMGGQRCLAGTRIIVLDSVYEALVQRVAELSDEIVVGAGRDSGVTMGPVVTRESRDRLVSLIGEAIDGGATAVRDGRTVDLKASPSATDRGYFVGPTILTGLSTSHPAEYQESFGPIIAIHRVKSLDEAIRVANDTQFGNAATLYTKSGSNALAFENGIRSGNIGINTFPAPPFNFTMGGLGTSFYGERHVCGDGPLDFYTEEKLVVARW